MSSKVYNVGVIGCGRVLRHYMALFDLGHFQNFNFVAWCDNKVEKALFFSSKYGGSAYSAISDMLEIEHDKLDFILVLTPSGLHYEHSKLCLESKIGVVVEKPLTLRIDHSEDLISIAKNKNVAFFSILQNRHNTAVIACKEMLSNGEIGRVLGGYLRLRWSRNQEYYNDDWHGKYALDGGVVAQQAIHHFDALELMVGPLKSAFAISKTLSHKMEAEDYAVGILENVNGNLFTFEVTTCVAETDQEAVISILGTEGELILGGQAINKLTLRKLMDGKWVEKSICDEEVPNGYGIGHISQLSQIIDNFNDLSFRQKNQTNAKIAVEIINMIYASCETQEWAKLGSNSTRLGIK